MVRMLQEADGTIFVDAWFSGQRAVDKQALFSFLPVEQS